MAVVFLTMVTLYRNFKKGFLQTNGLTLKDLATRKMLKNY